MKYGIAVTIEEMVTTIVINSFLDASGMGNEDNLDFLYGEVKRSLDNQVDRSERISEQAHKLIRNYVLSLSAVGAIISVYDGPNSSTPSVSNLISNADDLGLAVASFMFGFITLLTALVSLVIAAQDSEVTRGPGSNDLRTLHETQDNATISKYYLLHEGYLEWLKRLSNQNHKRQRMLKYAYTFSAFAILMFLVFIMVTSGAGGSS